LIVMWGWGGGWEAARGRSGRAASDHA
jgi:hypothetical protein